MLTWCKVFLGGYETLERSREYRMFFFLYSRTLFPAGPLEILFEGAESTVLYLKRAWAERENWMLKQNAWAWASGSSIAFQSCSMYAICWFVRQSYSEPDSAPYGRWTKGQWRGGLLWANISSSCGESNHVWDGTWKNKQYFYRALVSKPFSKASDRSPSGFVVGAATTIRTSFPFTEIFSSSIKVGVFMQSTAKDVYVHVDVVPRRFRGRSIDLSRRSEDKVESRQCNVTATTFLPATSTLSSTLIKRLTGSAVTVKLRAMVKRWEGSYHGRKPRLNTRNGLYRSPPC